MKFYIHLKFKKGELYSPDSLIDVPQKCNEYFSQENLEEWGNKDYEYGTLMCVKSFSVKFTIEDF